MANISEDLCSLESIFLTVGTVEDDVDLENCLKTLLPQTISMLSSPADQVRNKVLELLTHVNKRLKSRSQVRLPVGTLINLYLDPSASSFIVNFTVIYIKLGFPRLEASERAELLPLLIKAGETRTQHRDSLVYLALGGLEAVKFPQALRAGSFLGLDQAPKVASNFLTTIQHILLFPYGYKGDGEPPPELSKFSCDELLANLPQISKGDTLEQLKVTCVKLLSCGVYTDKRVFASLVIASADPRSSVFNLADAQLRKISGSVDLGEREVVGPLYSVYMGSTNVGGAANKEAQRSEGGESRSSNTTTVANDKRRGPACTRLRLKLLPYMAKSKLIVWPTAIQVMFDSLYGENTNGKLRSIALIFCLNMLKNLSDSQLKHAGEVLLRSGLLQLLTCDWAEPTLMRLVFPCIGLLVSRCPTLASPTLLQNLFNALINERERDVGSALRDCLVAMSVAYSGETDWLETLVTEGLASRSSLARLTSLHYLATALDSTTNRIYLLIQASNHQDEEVGNDAKKALYGVSFKTGGEIDASAIPDFADLLTLVLDRESAKPPDPRLHSEMVSYLRLCLAKAASCPLSLEHLQHPCPSSPAISKYLSNLHKTQPALIPRYVSFIVKIILANIRAEPLGALIETLGCLPEVVRPLVEPNIDKFMSELGHSKEEIRCLVGRIVGLACRTSDSQQMIELMSAATKTQQQAADLDRAHGCLLAAAYLYERSALEPDFRPPPSSLMISVVAGLKRDPAVIVSGWCVWTSVVGRSSPLPLSSEDKESIVDNLFSIVFSTKHSSKIKEQACHALGMLCVGDPNFPHREKIMTHFIEKTTEVKDVELVLSVGETLVACVLGPGCEDGRDPWTRIQSHADYTPDIASSRLVESLLPLVPNPHPNTRQCCCFWLLSLAKHCSHLDSVKTKLDELQNAFMEMLSDASSLVQEASSKGLALVYSSGGGSVDRSLLVQRLVDQLTSGKRSVSQVTKDTKLFEEGQLGKSPMGGNLSTYKELCSLASDLNQPDLVYKFMNLANHNALWNSKKGAAFGVGTLVDLAAGEMDAHLPKIIPKLYRYQYDPTPGIQQTMASIWQAFTSNIPNVLEKYGKEIYLDLTSSVTSGQWRVRLSTCRALSDFIRSPPAHNIMFQECVDKLKDLWTQLLRVMDDVHEATRESATSTTKTLTRLCVRECEKTVTRRDVIASVVLPVLLERGVTSNVPEVRNLSAEALCSLVKVGVGESEVIRLIPALLTASQHLDYSSLSHLSTMVSGSEAAQEVVDSVRASAVKSHFTVQTLSRCVDYVKPGMLAELTPHLVDNLKSGVGLGTRLATCHFVTLLCHSVHKDQIQPYIGKFLGALLPGLSDRNGAVRRQYATTIGQLCSYAKESSLDRLLDKLNTLYFDKEDEGVRLAVGYTLQAMLNYQQEAMRTRARALLPLAFFARHQIKLADGSNEKCVTLWEEISDDVGGGSGVSTHCGQIATLLMETLSSTAWQTKAQAGRSVKTLVSKAGDSLEPAIVVRLVSTLVDNLAGRSWDGKEALLHALAALAKFQQTADVLDVLERECSRGSLSYRCEALKALGEALAAVPNHNRYPALLDINRNILSDDVNKDDDDENDKKDLKNSLIQTSLEALGKAFPTDPAIQHEVIVEVVNLTERLETSTRSVQVAIMSTVVRSLEGLHAPLLTDSIVDSSMKALQYSLSIPKHTWLRKEALNLFLVLLRRLRDTSGGHMKRLETIFLEFKEELEKDNSSEVRTRLSDVKQAFEV